MQGGGFILAALAPWIVAQLHQSSGSWTPGWLYQAGVAALVGLLSARFNPRHYAQRLRAPAT
jgi:CP family cyanate transporter-like MFS transporter